MGEDDPLTMDHPGHVNQGVRDALDKAAQCARTVLEVLDTEALPQAIEALPQGSRERQKAVDAHDDELQRRAIANGMGAVLHLGRAVAYAVEDVVLAIYEHAGP